MNTLQDQIAQAETLVQESHYEDAVSAFQAAIETAISQSALNSAAQCYARMSWTAWQSGRVEQAAQFCEEGVARLVNAPSSPQLAALYQEAARSQAYIGNTSRARPLATRALELARQFDLRDVQAEALNTLSMASWGIEKPDDLIAMSREAVSLSDAVGSKLGGARAHNNLGTALGDKMGRWREAQFHFRRGVELNKELDFKIGMLFGMANVANTALFLGDIRDARKQLRALQEMLASLQGKSVAGFAVSLYEARLFRQEGKVDQALEDFAALYRDAYDARDSQQIAESLAWLADLAHELNRLDDVLPELEHIRDENFNPIYIILARAYQAVAYAQQGRWNDSQTALNRGAALTQNIPGTWGELWLKLAEIRIMVMQGHALEALAEYEKLSDDFMRREMRWHRAHLRFEHAETARLAGRQSQATYLLREAFGEFTSMGVDYYAKQAQDQMKELSK